MNQKIMLVLVLITCVINLASVGTGYSLAPSPRSSLSKSHAAAAYSYGNMTNTSMVHVDMLYEDDLSCLPLCMEHDEAVGGIPLMPVFKDNKCICCIEMLPEDGDLLCVDLCMEYQDMGSFPFVPMLKDYRCVCCMVGYEYPPPPPPPPSPSPSPTPSPSPLNGLEYDTSSSSPVINGLAIVCAYYVGYYFMI